MFAISPAIDIRHWQGHSFFAACNKKMQFKPGKNFTVFLLFFGVAVIEAFQTRNWIKAIFWVAIGLVFLAADDPKKTY